MKSISRERWREVYASALMDMEVASHCYLSRYGKGLINTNSAADAMAEELGIELEDPEPPEVELARLIIGFGVNYLFTSGGKFGWRCTPEAMKLADNLAQKILNDYER